ncbi:YgaP family membrane protein [Candidatus Marinarcus aquaticus]|uniref:Inner membrane protein YgaP-like transmembrane domain-containing protein n=1 Tax=Candidatus Marinarcus aquaticus TaxID=2044504 RepID=A0A4Q0XSK6_9BACT|nr:DUF2892 domain-containing protein [Candidatus Marinarcus aquaticus]RXJ59983.1 hypothetical protein CRV04_02910 [Candidatus Marinarcus aquaticus]
MNLFDKIKRFCRSFRVIFGVIFIAIGLITGNAWFFLGIIPLIAGVTNFCPLCMITKKCSI